MNGDLQYDYIEHLHGRGAADQWLQKKKLEEIRKQNIINQYAPPLVSPDQMVRAAQKAVGDIPGGLLSEEGPGQMAPPSPLEGAYVNKIPSQHDIWREQAKIKDFYSQAPTEGVGGGYKSTLSDLQGYSILPPPQYAGSPGSPHSIDLETVSGESIPGPEVTPLQQRFMNAQMVPGFYEAFGGGHPDEISLTQAPQHYGYDQFSRPKGLLHTPTPTKQVSEIPGDELLREETGWNRDRRFPNWMSLVNQGMEIYGG